MPLRQYQSLRGFTCPAPLSTATPGALPTEMGCIRGRNTDGAPPSLRGERERERVETPRRLSRKRLSRKRTLAKAHSRRSAFRESAFRRSAFRESAFRESALSQKRLSRKRLSRKRLNEFAARSGVRSRCRTAAGACTMCRERSSISNHPLSARFAQWSHSC